MPETIASRTTREPSNTPFAIRYVLMTTDQVPPDLVAEWLNEDLFRRYCEKRRLERGRRAVSERTT